MKNLITILSLIFATTTTHAIDCIAKLSDPNWTENKHMLVLGCEKIEDLVGTSEYDRVCFGITKQQYGNFKDTWFQTLRYNSEFQGRLKTIVSMDENGAVGEEDHVSRKGSVLKVSHESESFEFGQKWIDTTIVDLQDTSKLKFETHNKKFLSKKLQQSSLYSCKRVL